jgi:hypothetical protein
MTTAHPATAAELERIALLYIDALLAADDSAVPLCPHIRRAHLIVHCGTPAVWQIAEGADVVRRNIREERLTARRNMRLTVDSARSTVVVLWESGMDSEAAAAITIMDRFVIRDGLISELEIISIPQGKPFECVAYSD